MAARLASLDVRHANWALSGADWLRCQWPSCHPDNNIRTGRGCQMLFRALFGCVRPGAIAIPLWLILLTCGGRECLSVFPAPLLVSAAGMPKVAEPSRHENPSTRKTGLRKRNYRAYPPRRCAGLEAGKVQCSRRVVEPTNYCAKHAGQERRGAPRRKGTGTPLRRMC
jgi:hypothetical protein